MSSHDESESAPLGLWRTFGAFAAALLIGITAAIGVALNSDGAGWADGLRWTIYMLSAGSIAAIVGLIFGVPRARADYSPEASERYLANSNLEQISDWLTKLLVGAGLVELKSLPSGLDSLGDFLGADLAVPNASAYAVSAVLYGSGVGFGAGYLWTRLRLRLYLERSDRAAAEASRTREEIVARLREASGLPDAVSERESSLRHTAERALATVGQADVDRPSPILWVDDHPENNLAIVRALNSLGIRVDTVLSTTEALARLQTTDYALVISDLGRIEDSQNKPMAGRELIEEIREAELAVPVVIYAGQRAMHQRQALEAAGARRVAARASEVFEEAVKAATGASP
jgi:CheY-like chemotaxis protein